MKNISWKVVRRFLPVLLQHLAALGAAMMIGVIYLNSNFLIENMYTDRVVYSINLLEDSEEFEDSDIFADMFRNAINDITRLAVIKGQLETDGEFDGNKLIDVTSYVNRKTQQSTCPITAVYYLDDLIRWGKYGVEMQDTRFQSKAEFLSYFGLKDLTTAAQGMGVELPYVTEDETGSEEQTGNIAAEEDSISVIQRIQYENLDDFYEYVTDQMAEQTGKNVTILNQGSQEIVYLTMLECRYDTVDGLKLANIASNWQEYSMLEANVVEAINTLSYNYTQYQNQNDLYAQGNTNLQFLIRTKTTDGIQYYTNLPADLVRRDDATQNEYFKSLGRYVIYSPDDMKFYSNVNITEAEMFANVSGFEYAFPENTQIWIGVDTDYPVTTDHFAYVHSCYDNIVPNLWRNVIIVGMCAAVWVVLWIYLSATTGKETDEEGKTVYKLYWFDRMSTEILILLAAAAAGLSIWGMRYIIYTTEYNIYYRYSTWVQDTSHTKQYLSLVIAGYGFALSFVFGFFWCSLMRRIRGENLWQRSLLRRICLMIGRLGRRISENKSAVIRVLLPYNFFLFINLAVIILCMESPDQISQELRIGGVAGIMIADAIAGMVLFHRASERDEIMDGVNRIREGDVQYELESESMHGENKMLAESVNKIGEGIRKAVETSMKDERMKADLITNVSHDIKTPLTSIINYVALLKRENITNQPAKGYIEVLDSKSQRLKQLTDDLVEASKISSGNIVLEMDRIDLAELIKQSLGEFDEKLEARGLQAYYSSCEGPAYIYADSRRMWRVVENLFNNICKYAMPNTRIYIDLIRESGYVEVSLKNMSETPLNISPDELTERFIRGDSSRTTEGSGLGLSIAKNLTELQKGEFKIVLDGDLFKAVLRFEEFCE